MFAFAHACCTLDDIVDYARQACKTLPIRRDVITLFLRERDTKREIARPSRARAAALFGDHCVRPIDPRPHRLRCCIRGPPARAPPVARSLQEFLEAAKHTALWEGEEMCVVRW